MVSKGGNGCLFRQKRKEMKNKATMSQGGHKHFLEEEDGRRLCFVNIASRSSVTTFFLGEEPAMDLDESL